MRSSFCLWFQTLLSCPLINRRPLSEYVLLSVGSLAAYLHVLVRFLLKVHSKTLATGPQYVNMLSCILFLSCQPVVLLMRSRSFVIQ